MPSLSSRLRLVLPAAFLALAVGCVQQAHFATNFYQGERRYIIALDGPALPVISKTADVVEIQFWGHAIRIEKTRVTIDNETKALDPACEAITINVTRERAKISACGNELFYKAL